MADPAQPASGAVSPPITISSASPIVNAIQAPAAVLIAFGLGYLVHPHPITQTEIYTVAPALTAVLALAAQRGWTAWVRGRRAVIMADAAPDEAAKVVPSRWLK